MSKLIRGDKLSARNREMVLHQFVHRHTIENANQRHGGRCVLCTMRKARGGELTIEKDGKQIPWHEYHVPATTDAEWLASHAFHVTKSGDLDYRYDHCEPANLANGETDA